MTSTLSPDTAIGGQPWQLYRRRVHVRRDSEGRWFWVHYACRAATAEIGSFQDALGQAVEHVRVSPCQSSTKLFGDHIAVNCDANRLRASWLCPECKQYCSSHNPCDCCMDVAEEALDG